MNNCHFVEKKIRKNIHQIVNVYPGGARFQEITSDLVHFYKYLLLVILLNLIFKKKKKINFLATQNPSKILLLKLGVENLF